jgi:hypothetical protein
MAECRGLAPLARRHALVSTEARFARPVGIPEWSARGDLHSQGYSVLSRNGLLFPLNHVPVGAAGLAPARLSDFKSLWSAIPDKAMRREMVLAFGACKHAIESPANLSPCRAMPARRWLRPNGPRGRSCTCTLEGLSFVPLRWATRGEIGTPGRNLACNLRVRSAALYRLSYGSKVEEGTQKAKVAPSYDARRAFQLFFNLPSLSRNGGSPSRRRETRALPPKAFGAASLQCLQPESGRASG